MVCKLPRDLLSGPPQHHPPTSLPHSLSSSPSDCLSAPDHIQLILALGSYRATLFLYLGPCSPGSHIVLSVIMSRVTFSQRGSFPEHPIRAASLPPNPDSLCHTIHFCFLSHLSQSTVILFTPIYLFVCLPMLQCKLQGT